MENMPCPEPQFIHCWEQHPSDLTFTMKQCVDETRDHPMTQPRFCFRIWLLQHLQSRLRDSLVYLQRRRSQEEYSKLARRCKLLVCWYSWNVVFFKTLAIAMERTALGLGFREIYLCVYHTYFFGGFCLRWSAIPLPVARARSRT